MKKTIKRYHTPGTAPGTLIPTAPGQTPPRIVQTVYDAHSHTERELHAIPSAVSDPDTETIRWLHVQGAPTSALLEQLRDRFGLHALALEDVQNTGQRPKLQVFGDHCFIVAAIPVIADGEVHHEQINLFYGRRFVVSMANGGNDPFTPVRQRLRANGSPFRSLGADHLLYALIDLIIDEGFPVLEKLGERIEALEQEVLNAPSRECVEKLHHIKRSLLVLRRMLWPQRELVNALLREDAVPLSDHTRLYLRDCYDHSIQLMELLENYRDMSTNILDVYLSSINLHTNDVMRTLTVISTIFLPLTFIVGVYGMNFGNGNTGQSPLAMPELNSYYGYPTVMLAMVAIAAGMLVYFKRKRWF